MASILVPVLSVGAAETARNQAIRTYADRETFGLEAPASSRADLAGPNEHLRYLRSVLSWANVEHGPDGVHDTLQIARAFCKVDWDGTAYTVDPDSYSMGTRQADATVFTITPGAAGEITIDLAVAYQLPSAAAYGLHDRTQAVIPTYGSFPNFVKTQLKTRTNAKSFAIRRWEGTTRALLALTDGPFAFTINAEA